MSVVTLPVLPLSTPFGFYAGLSVSSDVPGKYPCALNGRPLMIDDGVQAQWSHQGIQQIRQQADSSTSPSEASLNPAGLWRRAQESWHRGAGQTYRDKTDADPFRYSASKGIDPWTPYELSLLPDSDQKLSTAATNLYLMPAGARCYASDGTAVKYTTDITVDSPSWSTVTGTSGQAVTALASDGFNVYIGSGTSGIYKTDTSTGAAASFVTGTVSGPVAYVKGRLMAANANSIYNIVASGALPTPLLTQNNSAFTWVGFAEGTASIYAAGYAGDKSLVYRVAVKADGSALDAPVVAGELPDGEIVASIGGYLGFVFLGTSRGVRFCEPDGQGNLTIGPLIEVGDPVLCFEGQQSFVWFGWTAYDGSSTGLGRMDLRQFTEDIVTGGRKPAYASDLMVTGQAAVQSVVTFNDLRVFTVSGSGVWAEDTDLVTSGTISSGQIGFGLPDPKTAISLNVQTQPLDGSFSATLTTDSGSPVTVGTQTIANENSTDFPLDNTSGELFEITFTITRDAVTTVGPVLTRWTVKVAPGANDGPAEYLMIPFLLHRTIRLGTNETVYFDVNFERNTIKSLRESRRVVTFQDCDKSYLVIVENYEWTPVGLRYDVATGSYRTPDGTMLTQLKVIA